ncbi:MAG: PRC-barrel domain-containing protein [Acutalibacteraceae bacterium]
MNCSITDLRNKEVINAKNGCRIGNVCDVEIDTCTGKLVSIIVFGRNRLLGLLQNDGDVRICWEDIQVIGDDTILVCSQQCFTCNNKRRGFFDFLFK